MGWSEGHVWMRELERECLRAFGDNERGNNSWLSNATMPISVAADSPARLQPDQTPVEQGFESRRRLLGWERGGYMEMDSHGWMEDEPGTCVQDFFKPH